MPSRRSGGARTQQEQRRFAGLQHAAFSALDDLERIRIRNRDHRYQARRIARNQILIEFDHQRPANLARFAKDPNMPTRQHIHCVVRTPNGNDYGKDLLRQHYQAHAHA